MDLNSFGRIFQFSTWGESHGKAIGAMIDGVPSRVPLDEGFIQHYLDRRRPGNSSYVSQRKEQDKVSILSGVFQGKTTGAPISLIIYNQDHRSADYEYIKDKFRPGHADYAYWKKYGHYDYRGGGRASGRETALRVAAGAIARKILGDKINIRGAVVQIGKEQINYDNFSWSEVENNPFRCPDKFCVPRWEKYLQELVRQKSSIGAIIELRAENVPPGLGEPIYHKLDAAIAYAIMSIGAVKGVEIGSGFKSATMQGLEHNDEMRTDHKFLSNNNGGVLGGISSGQDIIVRFVVKPTSSLAASQKTIDTSGKDIDIVRESGRHDPCIGIRAAVVGEAMLACVLADFCLLNKRFG